MSLQEAIWHNLRHTTVGRIVAGSLITLPCGVAAALSIKATGVTLLFCLLGTCAIGALAVVCLEIRDRKRNNSAKWIEKVATTAADFHEIAPHIPIDQLPRSAQEKAENKLTPLTYLIMAIGAFSMLCGVATFIVKLIKLF